jgi:VanZ family protein
MQRLLVHNLFKIIAVFWTLLIFYLCLDEAPPSIPKFTFQYNDKIVHFIFYFIFVYFWAKSLKNKNVNSIIIIIFFALLIGVLIEFLQVNITHNRTFDWYDILANVIGTLTSFMCLQKSFVIKSNKKISPK